MLILLVLLQSNTYNKHETKNNFFTLLELQNLTAKNGTDFETEVLTKGFSYNSKISTTDFKYYSSDTKRDNGRADQIAKLKISDTLYASDFIEYNTTDKTVYLNFKTSLATNGYKFTKEEGIFYYYNNSKYTAILTNQIYQGASWYCMTVYKRK